MPESHAPPDLDQPLGRIAAAIAAVPTAPVERWTPAACGVSGIRIAADGRWWHEGRPIERAPLVRQLARVLTRDPDGACWLVTPHERMAVAVDDLPFVASLVRSDGEGEVRRLLFVLGTGEPVIAGAARPLVAADASRGLPALGLDRGLSARIDRASWIALAEIALADEGRIWSDGACFTLA